MRLEIKSTNIELNDRLKFLIEEKLGKPLIELLGKLDQKANIILDVEIGKITKHHHKGKIWLAEANLDLPGLKNVLRASAVTESLEASLDGVKNRLFTELKKYKEKPRDKSIHKFRYPRPASGRQVGL